MDYYIAVSDTDTRRHLRSVNLHYRVSGSTLNGVGLVQLPVLRFGTLSRNTAISTDCLRRICSPDTSASSELAVL